MKKKYIFIEFIFVCLFFLLPPLFTQKVQNNISFSWQNVIYQLLIALSLNFMQKKSLPPKVTLYKNVNILNFLSYFPLTLGSLLIFNALIFTLNLYITKTTYNISNLSSQNINIGLIIQFLVAAFYEETLYRSFVPEFILYLFDKKTFRLPLEIICIVLFAFSHKYMGYAAVINAFLGGIALRLCAIKTRGIFTGVMAHFTYNLLILVFTVYVAIA